MIDTLREWVRTAPHSVEILPCTQPDGERTLTALHESDASALGAVARHTGGLLVDRGWLRILGAGSPRLPRALDRWNDLGTAARRMDGALLIADDVLGGFFTLSSDQVRYLAPDTMEWEELGVDYADWLSGVLSDRLAGFYEDLRWDGWETDIARVGSDEALHVWPPLWSAEEPSGATRRPVPIEGLWHYQTGLAAKLSEVPDGGEVEILWEDWEE